MNRSTSRGITLLAAACLVAACTSSSSTGPSNSGTKADVTGTYRLTTVRGVALPVPLFGQCSLGAPSPCAACAESAGSGTLTLKDNPREFSIALVANGICTDPLGRSPTTTSTYTVAAGGSWQDSGGVAISFQANNMNLSTATVSGSQLTASFNWLSPDPGGQAVAVTAVFNK